jgi:hypothetical protein
MGAIIFVPLALIRAYDIPAVCVLKFPPILPACVFDDLYDIVDTAILARHIAWPEGLSPDGFNRTDTRATRSYGGVTHRVQALVSPVADCAALGFDDGLTTMFYYLQRESGNAWREYVPLSTMSVVLGTSTLDDYATFWLNKTTTDARYTACAQLGLINVPLSVSLILLSVILLVVVLQVLLVLLKSVLALVARLM